MLVPLSIAFAKKYKVTGYDINKARVDELKNYMTEPMRYLDLFLINA